MITGSRKPGVFINTAHHENNNDNKKMITIIIKHNNRTIIIKTTMALSFNHGYHWVEVRWDDLSVFTSEKNIESKFRGKNLGYCYSSIVLKTNPTFRWICQLNMSVRWSNQIEKIGSAYIYKHIYHIFHIHIIYTLRWWFHLSSAYLHII